MRATRSGEHRDPAFGAAIVAAFAAAVLMVTATMASTTRPAERIRDRSDLTKAPRCTIEGAAWIGTFGYGLSCLDQDGWHTYTDDTSPLASDLVVAVSIGPDGRAWIVNSSGVSVTNGRTWNTYDSAAWDISSPTAVAFDAAGDPWVSHYEGVSHLADKTWTTWPATLLGTGDNVNLVNGVAVAPDGTVWAVTANSIAAFDGSGWTIFEEGDGLDDQYFFSDIVAGSGGIWAAHSGGVLEWVDGTWVPHTGDTLSQVQHIAMGPDGSVWVATWAAGVSQYDGTGWLTFDRANDGLSSDSIRSIAVDAAGRVWAGTAWGLDVYDRETWQTVHMSDSPLLDNKIVAVGVAGAGPVLPDPEPAAPGAMSGRLVQGGAPVGGATLQLCTEEIPYQTIADETPCADHPFSLVTTSDPDGSFRFSEVPRGRYGVVAQDGQRQWLDVTELAAEPYRRPLVDAGVTLDLGTLDLATLD